MTEWTIVGVIVVLIGLVGACAKPLLKFNTSIVENTTATKNLTETMKCNENKNQKEHSEIRKNIGKHGETLTDHEARIKVIESKEN